ncbi:MAG: aldo/keto reductase [Phototrophicaceae bacterium]
MKSSLKIPTIGFGTAPLATPPAWNSGELIPETQAVEALEFAYENGITYFDTAPNYGKGLAESRTGLVIGQLPRERITIATKVGFDISGDTVQRDYSRDGILRSLEGSLKRLKVDSIDILHVHDPDFHFDEVVTHTLPTLVELRRQGVIKAIGAGMNQWEMLLRFSETNMFDCFMIASRYTLLEQGALPLLKHSFEKNIPIIAASIYNSGILATGTHTSTPRYNHGQAPIEVIERIGRIETICDSFSIPLHVAANQFPLANPAIQSIVVGFQKPSEVQTCLDAIQQDIPPAFWETLQAEHLIISEAPIPKVDHYE